MYFVVFSKVRVISSISRDDQKGTLSFCMNDVLVKPGLKIEKQHQSTLTQWWIYNLMHRIQVLLLIRNTDKDGWCIYLGEKKNTWKSPRAKKYETLQMYSNDFLKQSKS